MQFFVLFTDRRPRGSTSHDFGSFKEPTFRKEVSLFLVWFSLFLIYNFTIPIDLPCAAIQCSDFLPLRDTRSRKGKLILFAEHCPLGGSYVRMLCDHILAGSGVNFALADMP